MAISQKEIGHNLTALQELRGLYREMAILGSAAAALSWDQEVMMPKKGIDQRADELELLAGIAHARATNPRIGELLAAIDEAGLDEDERADLRIMRDDYADATRIPADLATALAAHASRAQVIWAKARAEHDVAAFLPALAEMINLKRQEADALRSGAQSRYDALLGQFERGISTDEITSMFDEIRAPLRALSSAIAEKPTPAALTGHFPRAEQLALAHEIAADFGYNFDTGRLDLAVHPFSTGTMDDTRITTRIDEADPWNCLYSTIHETGHSVYEGALPRDWRYRPIGQHASLGIHESQSRFFENQIGRSRPYMAVLAGKMAAHFGGTYDAKTLYAQVNRVTRGFIRTEADEVHYNLHVALRFELEQALIGGDLEVADLEAAWNAAFKRDFDLDVPTPAMGVLQDVHWSAGLFGYFPTYSLGNINAANLDKAMRDEIPDRDAMVAAGENGAWIEWLRRRVYAQGRRYLGRDLMANILGRPSQGAGLVEYLEDKFGALYAL